MSYRYLDHEADVGFEAIGNSLEEAFSEAALATFNVMVDLKEVTPAKRIAVACKSDTIPNLFIQWLNELISLADMNSMFFSEFKVDKIIKDGGGYNLKGSAAGEEINLERHTLKTEVKAATYYGLKYEMKGRKHIFRCVVDV
jgi:SHS2 domain-containing protein